MDNLLLKKTLFIKAAIINIIIRIKIGIYISGSLIKLDHASESFLLKKFPTPAPKEFIMNTPGIKPNKVAKKYFFILIPKITGKTFCIGNGMPPPVNLNNT